MNYPKFKLYANTCSDCTAESEHCVVECAQRREDAFAEQSSNTDFYFVDACFTNEDVISTPDKKTMNYVNKYCTL